jgi:hypothetical protein
MPSDASPTAPGTQPPADNNDNPGNTPQPH